MKKKLGLLLFVGIVLGLTGCSKTGPLEGSYPGISAEMYVVEDSSYNLTPQEYIAKINDVVSAQNDSRYCEIPDFESSGETIDIDFIYLNLKISTNDAGEITEIYYTWDGTRTDVGYSIGLYVGYTAELLGLDADNLYDSLDMMNVDSASHETSYAGNGTLFSYSTLGHGQFNYLTIRPESNPDN